MYMWFARKVDLQVLPAGREAMSGARITCLKNQEAITLSATSLAICCGGDKVREAPLCGRDAWQDTVSRNRPSDAL